MNDRRGTGKGHVAQKQEAQLKPSMTRPCRHVGGRRGTTTLVPNLDTRWR